MERSKETSDLESYHRIAWPKLKHGVSFVQSNELPHRHFEVLRRDIVHLNCRSIAACCGIDCPWCW